MREPARSLSASTVYDVNVHWGNHCCCVIAWVKKTHAIGLVEAM